MRRLTTSLLGLAAALLPAAAIFNQAPSTTPTRRRVEVRKAQKSNHAEIAAWNQAVERRNAEKRAEKLATTAGRKERR